MYKHLTIVALIGLFFASQVSANTPPSADFDGDGIVGIPDFLLFADVFGSSQGDEKYEVRYDLDGNGKIGIPDFLIFVDNFGKQVPPISQREVLVALYHATDGANWTNNTNWLSDNDISTWSQVDVSADGQVTALYLQDNNLKGELPQELGNLANLIHLNLGGNELSWFYSIRIGQPDQSHSTATSRQSVEWFYSIRIGQAI